MKLRIVYKGGEGSGNFGHSGRPGKLGGSATGGAKSKFTSSTGGGANKKNPFKLPSIDGMKFGNKKHGRSSSRVYNGNDTMEDLIDKFRKTGYKVTSHTGDYASMYHPNLSGVKIQFHRVDDFTTDIELDEPWM